MSPGEGPPLLVDSWCLELTRSPKLHHSPETVLFVDPSVKTWEFEKTDVIEGKLTLTSKRIIFQQNGANKGFIYTWPELTIYGIAGTGRPDEDDAKEGKDEEEKDSKCSLLCCFLGEFDDFEAFEEDYESSQKTLYISFDSTENLGKAQDVFNEYYVHDEDIEGMMNEDEDIEFGDMDEDAQFDGL